jgi:hypothetical protein
VGRAENISAANGLFFDECTCFQRYSQVAHEVVSLFAEFLLRGVAAAQLTRPHHYRSDLPGRIYPIRTKCATCFLSLIYRLTFKRARWTVFKFFASELW